MQELVQNSEERTISLDSQGIWGITILFAPTELGF